MRPLRFLAVCAVLLVIALVAPVRADHVSEPTAPITGLILRVVHYASGTVAPCDGETPFHHDSVRVEIWVNSASRPSEHFHVTEVVTATIAQPDPKLGTRLVEVNIWGADWFHQNIPPHPSVLKPGLGWNTTGTNNNSYRLSELPGVWRFAVSVRGGESGTSFTAECRVLIPADTT